MRPAASAMMSPAPPVVYDPMRNYDEFTHEGCRHAYQAAGYDEFLSIVAAINAPMEAQGWAMSREP